jgi:ATP-dependent Clp protease ATP-binding subunit ClpA
MNLKLLVDKGTDLKYGARPLRRTIQRYIENPLAEQILKGSFEKGDDISAELGKDDDKEFCANFKVVGKIEINEEENKAEQKNNAVVAVKEKKSSEDPTTERE